MAESAASKLATLNVATRRPASIGRCYYLCRDCRGTGEGRQRSADAEKAPKVELITSRFRGPRCERCNGIGLELR